MQNDLTQALDALQEAIRRADFLALQGCTTEIEAALDTLPRDLNEARLMQLRAQAARSMTALEAMGRGLRAARRRLEEVAESARGTGTYDNRGRRNLLPVAAHPPRRA